MPVSWKRASGLVALMLPKSKIENGAVRVCVEFKIRPAKVREFSRRGVMVQVSPSLKECVVWSCPILRSEDREWRRARLRGVQDQAGEGKGVQQARRNGPGAAKLEGVRRLVLSDFVIEQRV